MSIKTTTFTLALSLLFTAQSWAQQIEIFPSGYLSEPITYIEKDSIDKPLTPEIAVLRKTDVGTPMFTIYRAEKLNNKDLTVVVCPGGGYNLLAYNKEGSEICELLNANGFDAVLLKYRVPRRENREKHEAPLEDLQRTISLLRTNAQEYGIRDGQIGVMGFSAGAHLSVMACCSSRTYAPIDEADEANCRPDFCALIYPAYLSGENFQLSQEVTVSEQTPPTFIVQSEDDHNYIDSSIFYYYALKEAKIPATMHLYPNGGHGFGARRTGSAAQDWPMEYVRWLGDL